jgi:DinB family protein
MASHARVVSQRGHVVAARRDDSLSALPRAPRDFLVTLLDELQARVSALTISQDDAALYWQPDPGANSSGVTIWHVTRWLDVLSVRVMDGLPSDQEVWFASGWSQRTGYDPRGLGECGLGVLTGYTMDQVLEVPHLSSRDLLSYQREALARLRSRILALDEGALADVPRDATPLRVRARLAGELPLYGWIVFLLLGCFQHIGEVAALQAMRSRRRQE